MPGLTGDPRWDQPCTVSLPTGEACGAMPSRRFLNWRGCIDHTPARLAGRPEPPKPTPFKPSENFLRANRAPEPPPVLPKVPNPEDMLPVERSKAAAEARQDAKARAAEARQQAREAAARSRQAAAR